MKLINDDEYQALVMFNVILGVVFVVFLFIDPIMTLTGVAAGIIYLVLTTIIADLWCKYGGSL